MTSHVPILLQPIVDGLLEPLCTPGLSPGWIVDCTLGGGGHTAAILKQLAALPGELGSRFRVLGVDQDAKAIAAATERFESEIKVGKLELRQTRFGQLDLGDRTVVGVLADLGFSSDQMDDPERGLSFRHTGPLDMRLDLGKGSPVSHYLKTMNEREIADVIWQYGEERYSRRIASAIVRARTEGRLPSTPADLAQVVTQALPTSARHQKIHPATRTFQAFRIFVNEELEELDQLLQRVILSIIQGGRVAILSFHSLEDRRVKEAFKMKDGPFRPLTKKPLIPSDAEIEANPRARSAKLRIAERI